MARRPQQPPDGLMAYRAAHDQAMRLTVTARADTDPARHQDAAAGHTKAAQLAPRLNQQRLHQAFAIYHIRATQPQELKADTHPAATERLMRYWAEGEGAAKIGWGSPGDYDRCLLELGKYVHGRTLHGLCANLHHRALGIWPATHARMEREGKAEAP